MPKEYDLNTPFIYKSIRSDESDFWLQFIEGITISVKTKNDKSKRPALRVGRKKKFGWRHDGPYEVGKNSLHPKEKKQFYSKHQSTSYADPLKNYLPPVFGFDKARETCLVGIRLSVNSILIQRILNGDGGTVNRPYQFDNEIDAIVDWEYKIFRRGIFSSLDYLAKLNDPSTYNEVMARLKWECDNSSQICIFSDNLQSRLLAQIRANQLMNRLKDQADENGFPLDKNYFVPISFYLPNTKSVRYYLATDQISDYQTGLSSADPKIKAMAIILTLQNSPEIDINELFIKNISNLDANEKMNSYQEIFNLAVKNNRLDIIKFLSQQPFDFSTLKINLLAKPAISGDLKAIKFIYDLNLFDINANNLGTGFNPLHAASFNGHLKIVKYLLEHGADVHANNIIGQSSIYLAIFNDHLTVLDELLKHVIDIKSIITPSNISDKAKILIDSYTLRDFYCPKNRTSIFSTDIKNAIEDMIHSPLDKESFTKLHSTIHTIQLKLCDSLISSLENSLDLTDIITASQLKIIKSHLLNIFDRDTASTACTIAIRQGFPQALKVLVKYENFNANDLIDNTSPIHLAVQQKNHELVIFLLKQDADVNKRYKGKSIFLVAYQNNDKATLHTILNNVKNIQKLVLPRRLNLETRFLVRCYKLRDKFPETDDLNSPSHQIRILIEETISKNPITAKDYSILLKSIKTIRENALLDLFGKANNQENLTEKLTLLEAAKNDAFFKAHRNDGFFKTIGNTRSVKKIARHIKQLKKSR